MLPNPVPASSANQNLTINGANFQSGCTLTFTDTSGGTFASTASKLTFNSSSRLTYSFNNASDAGTWKVKVNNPDGKSSSLYSFTVQAAALPAPTISGVLPNPVPASSANQNLTINGANFQSGCTLTFYDAGNRPISGNSSKLTFNSSSVLSYLFNNAGDVGTWKVSVTNPDGKSSTPFSFTISGSVLLPPQLTTPGTASFPSETLSNLGPTFQWTPAASATGYGLYVRDQTTGLIIYEIETLGAISSHLIPQGKLIAGHEFRWNMRAKNATGWSAFSNYRYFNTGRSANPDLAVTGISLTPAAAYPGGVVTASYRVTNIGNGDAPASRLSMRLSADGFADANDISLNPARIEMTALPAGKYQDRSISVSLPSALAAGRYKLIVISDIDREVSQASFANDIGVSSGFIDIQNSATATFTAFIESSSGYSVPPGEEVRFTAYVSGEPGSFSYAWLLNDRNIGSGRSVEIVAPGYLSVSRNNTIKLKVSNASGATVTTTKEFVFIAATQPPPVSAPPARVNLSPFSTMNPNLPTIVIVHGWQPGDSPEDVASSIVDGSIFTANHPLQWMGEMANAISNRLKSGYILHSSTVPGIQANIMCFAWQDAFTLYPEYTALGFAKSFTDDAGLRLANELKSKLGGNYTKPIHMIGHSLGSFVIARAANRLGETMPQAREIQLTVLDAPASVSADPNGALGAAAWMFHYPTDYIFYKYLSPKNVSWCDSYYAKYGYGNKIPGTAPNGGGFVDTDHSGIHDAYLNSITDGRSTAGFYNSIILGSWGGYADRPVPRNWSVPNRLEQIIDAPVNYVQGAVQQVVGVSHDTIDLAGNLLVNAISLEEHSPSEVSQYVTLPKRCVALSMQIRFPNIGDGDWLTVALNDEVLLNMMGTSAQTTNYMPVVVPVPLKYRGAVAEVRLRLNSVKMSNAVVNIGDITAISQKAATDSDMDGDGAADIAVYHPAAGNWHLIQSARGGRTRQFGWSEALPVPADYDGDGLMDIAVYHPAVGNWYILESSTGQRRIVQFGWGATVPVPGDYDNDGKADLAVYHQAAGRWYFLCSTAGRYSVQWGWSEAIPVPADYDGDGATDIGVYHPARGSWDVLPSSFPAIGPIQKQWGWGEAIPVPADYDGDGKADIAVFHRATGNWYIWGRRQPANWGWSEVTPVPADYDGDGAADLAVYHPQSGNWYIHKSTTGDNMVRNWGWSEARPILLYPLIHSWFNLP